MTSTDREPRSIETRLEHVVALPSSFRSQECEPGPSMSLAS
jgi:hypothetical protein